eukprot:g34969.t1
MKHHKVKNIFKAQQNLAKDGMKVAVAGTTASQHQGPSLDSMLEQPFVWSLHILPRPGGFAPGAPVSSHTPKICRRFVTMLGDIISEASDEVMLFYSTWNLYCLVRY